MSLISQRDRQLVVEALEYYRDDTLRREQAFKELQPSFDLPDIKVKPSFMMEINALINWIKLEHYKHEN